MIIHNRFSTITGFLTIKLDADLGADNDKCFRVFYIFSNPSVASTFVKHFGINLILVMEMLVKVFMHMGYINTNLQLMQVQVKFYRKCK